jgi:hypothetical protein
MTGQPGHDPLGDLAAAGVAVWLDDLSRELLAGGGLRSLVAGRHVVGVTGFLERDGLARFEKSWSELGATVAAEMARQHHAPRP